MDSGLTKYGGHNKYRPTDRTEREGEFTVFNQLDSLHIDVLTSSKIYMLSKITADDN